MGNLNPNSTNYFHSYEPNTNDLTMAMDYNICNLQYIDGSANDWLGPTHHANAFHASTVVTR